MSNQDAQALTLRTLDVVSSAGLRPNRSHAQRGLKGSRVVPAPDDRWCIRWRFGHGWQHRVCQGPSFKAAGTSSPRVARRLLYATQRRSSYDPQRCQATQSVGRTSATCLRSTNLNWREIALFTTILSITRW